MVKHGAYYQFRCAGKYCAGDGNRAGRQTPGGKWKITGGCL